jgi:ribosome maturation factor RimP
MIEKNHIEQLVNEYVKGTQVFLVAVKVSASNRITVLADTMKGITIDECVSLHRFIESRLDRDRDDYELQVSSPGLDSPFMVTDQYYKNEGKDVEVVNTDGEKYTGKLKNVTGGGFELETEIRKKGMPRELKDVSFNFDHVKSTRILIKF